MIGGTGRRMIGFYDRRNGEGGGEEEKKQENHCLRPLMHQAPFSGKRGGGEEQS